MKRSFRSRINTALSLAAISGMLFATTGKADASGIPASPPMGPFHWVGAWTASPQASNGSGIAQTGFNDQTIRMIVHPHLTGSEVRIRLSNTFGTQPVTFGKVDVALQSTGADIVTGSDHQVTFNNGQTSVTIPAGEEVWSDPMPFEVTSDHDLAISLYMPNGTGPVTYHPLARSTNYIFSGTGDHTSDISASASTTTTPSWYWIDGVSILSNPSVKGSIVAFGDSITDGVNSTVDANHRWADYLANRIAEPGSTLKMSVLDEGINANRIWQDASTIYGANQRALDRLDRDVLSQDGVQDVIMLLGINDIGHGNYNPKSVTDGMQQIIDRVHAKGLRIFGGTLTPIGGSKYDNPDAEKTREAVNTWIRTSGAFDGVVDFAKATEDPSNPQQFLPEFNSGDSLHPNDAGYQAMANAIDLKMLK